MKSYPDKFKLSHEQSLFLAKKKWDENVYCGMKMENRAVTFPQTKTILNGVNVPNVHLDDIQAILNMRDAWKFLINSIDTPMTLEYICKLNEFIARNEALQWGVLRSGSVAISGTDYTPPVPSYENAEKELAQLINENVSNTIKALNVFAWGARAQLFWDGNKRTSMTAANKILIQSGCGILTITDKYMEKFNEVLLDWYSTGNSNNLIEFLYSNCIQGIS